MGRASKYPDELKERAVRMVAEVAPSYGSQWAAICAVAGKLGIGSPETLRIWVRRSEVDAGARPGVTSVQSEETAQTLPHTICTPDGRTFLYSASPLTVGGRVGRYLSRARPAA